MVYNIWKDPEEDMERTAIDHYFDDLVGNGVMRDYHDLIIEGLISQESIKIPLMKELQKSYDVDMNNVGNINYFQQQFTERMKQFGFNLGKDIW